MDANQMTEILNTITTEQNYTLILSKKSNATAYGCYYIDKRQIKIYLDPQRTGEWLIYTAIHELAHHIQYTTHPICKGKKGVQPHGKEFKEIFERLINKAISKNIIKMPNSENYKMLESKGQDNVWLKSDEGKKCLYNLYLEYVEKKFPCDLRDLFKYHLHIFYTISKKLILQCIKENH